MTLVGEEEVLDALQWGLGAEVSNSFCEAFSNSFLDIFINCINMYLYQYCPYPLGPTDFRQAVCTSLGSRMIPLAPPPPSRHPPKM